MFGTIAIIMFVCSLVIVATCFACLYFLDGEKSSTNSAMSPSSSLSAVSAPAAAVSSSSSSDLIDHVFYTNLDSRPDRKYHIERELNRVGFQSKDITRNPGIIAKCPALGCSMAIYNALLQFENEAKWNNVLFMEDDIIFGLTKNEMNLTLLKFQNLKLDWDVLMLASNTIAFKQTNFDFLVRIIDGQTTAAFIVNRAFLPTLIQNVAEGIVKLSNETINSAYRIDMYWKSLQTTHNFFTFHPPMCYQRDSFSDIENRMITSYNDRKTLVFERKQLHFIICIKTTKSNLLLQTTKQQLEKLEFLRLHFPIDYFYYFANPEQKEDCIFNEQHRTLIIKATNDERDQSYMFGIMMSFLRNYVQATTNVNGVFLTEDSFAFSGTATTNFYSILQTNQHFPYWGNAVVDTKNGGNLTYDGNNSYPIAVPKVMFCARGSIFLTSKTLAQFANLDSFFPSFPQVCELQFHFDKDLEQFTDLKCFYDVQLGLALLSIGILPTNVVLF